MALFGSEEVGVGEDHCGSHHSPYWTQDPQSSKNHHGVPVVDFVHSHSLPDPVWLFSAANCPCNMTKVAQTREVFRPPAPSSSCESDP